MPGDMFDKVDTNKDGEITGEEIVQYTFAKVDANGDGQITEEEFIKACLANEEFLYSWTSLIASTWSL